MTYLNSMWWEQGASEPSAQDWEEFTYRRLIWLYGHERAALIKAGQDSATNADIAAWKRIVSPTNPKRAA